MTKYILVGWPEIQDFMEHPRWSECKFCIEIPTNPCEDNTYAVPEDLYYEVRKIKPQRFTKEEKDMLENVSNFISMAMFDLEEENPEDIELEKTFNKWITEN